MHECPSERDPEWILVVDIWQFRKKKICGLDVDSCPFQLSLERLLCAVDGKNTKTHSYEIL